MPRRRRTRAAELAHRIKRERAHVTQRNKPPPSGGDTAVAEGFEPRTVLAVSRFQGECIRPLCHATADKGNEPVA